jgi:hypothetical protein
MTLKSISELDNPNPDCMVCLGEGWVCDEHPLNPFSDCDCYGGAGMPCECNVELIKANREAMPGND